MSQTHKPLRVAIQGPQGKVGRALLSALIGHPEVQLTAAVVRSGSPWVGKSVSEIVPGHFIEITDDFNKVIDDVDVVIDFTRAEGTLRALESCVQHQKALVIGTTGFTPEDQEKIQKASRTIPILMAPNMSIGVNICLSILADVAKKCGETADIEIIEAHHRHKVDAPSGTSLKMGEVVANALGRNFKDVAVYDRHLQKQARQQEAIGISCIRAGNIVGDHTVLFALEGEQIEITHRAASRDIYAKGALRAATWLSDKPAGLYSMQDLVKA